MGNYHSSCTGPKNRLVAAKLIDSDGNCHDVKTPITVAELMLEEPGHVICPAEELVRTCRVAAMNANEELLPGIAYVMFPVSKAYSRLGNGVAAPSNGKKTTLKVDSAEEEQQQQQQEEEEEEEKDYRGFFSSRSMGKPGKWSPALRTIKEEEIFYSQEIIYSRSSSSSASSSSSIFCSFFSRYFSWVEHPLKP